MTLHKCVHVFDHHCKWLNQCIGRRNYSAFCVTVTTAILMALSYIGTYSTLVHHNGKLIFGFNTECLGRTGGD